WNSALDETNALVKVRAAEVRADLLDPVTSDGSSSVAAHGSASVSADEPDNSCHAGGSGSGTVDVIEHGGTITLDKARQPGLLLAFSPLLLGLALISGGAIAGVLGVESPIL
ncbi:hypothetical protein, partial [Escherichia coli]|uniref:hypothetical protein n=1 Tax=Escherichia coli TaxID=562 RepID=UPI0032E41AC5